MRPDHSAMRPLAPPESPSLVSQVITLVLTPVVYALALVSASIAWVGRAPLRCFVGCLKLLDGVISDILAFLTKQPCPKAQINSFQRTVVSLQQNNQAQHRQIMLLQNELDGLKLEKSKTQRKNIDLSKQVVGLQQRLTQLEADRAAQPSSPKAEAAAATKHAVADNPYSTAAPQAPGTAAEVTYDTKRWYLHACVALAALGVRWWLLHQTDPLQRKVMLVVIWPALWIYGAMIFNCLPQSSTLRAALACFCWALLGYIGHEVVSFSVRGQQQQIIHAAAAPAPSLHSVSGLGAASMQYSWAPAAAGRAA